jgi:hypothetical protein
VDLRVGRLVPGLVRSLDATGPQAVSHDRERLAWLPARRVACRAARRPGRGARGDPACPGLDTETGMNDSFPASRGRSKHATSSRSEAEHGAEYTARHLFARPRAGACLRADVSTAAGDTSARNLQAARWRAAALPSRSAHESPAPALNHSAP